jgi:hypothetical protein
MPGTTKIDFSREVFQYSATTTVLSGSTNILGSLFIGSVEIDPRNPLYGDNLIFDGQKFKAGNSSSFANRIVNGMDISVDPINALKFNIGLGQFVISNVQYFYSGGSVYVETGDTSLYRFDAIYVTSSNTAQVAMGDSSPSPITPNLTPEQLQLGLILIPPGYYSGTTGTTVFTPTIVDTVFRYFTGYTGAIERTDGYSQARSNFGLAFSRDSVTIGQDSVSLGIGTYASGNSQTVLGKYNIADPTAILVVGCGPNDLSRENAIIIDWQGNTFISKKFYIDNIQIDVSGSTHFGQYLMYDGTKYRPADLYIGDAEDNDYTDGLFTDFISTSTTIGVAVDRFNQILKALVPQPAPNLSYISGATFSTGYLSFGQSKSIDLYTNVTGITPNGTTILDLNGLFQAGSESLRRLGILNQNSSNITFKLNTNVSQSTQTPIPSYSAYSFNNGNVGVLQLELNGNVINILDLTTSTGATISSSGNSVINVGNVYNNKFASGSDFEFGSYRAGNVTFITTGSTSGWNYLRVVHILGSTVRYTNFIDWVYDPNTNGISLISSTLSNPIMGGSKYLSGVRYTTSGTSEYNTIVANVYRNVYATTPITFNTTSLTLTSTVAMGSGTTASIGTTSITLPLLNTSGNSHQTLLNVTGRTIISGTRLLGPLSFVGINSTYPHVFSTKALNNTGIQTKVGFLHYNINSNNTYKLEDFNDESKRMQNIDYTAATYTNINSSLYAWDSTLPLTASTSTYTNGLLQYNGALYYPNNTSLPNSGNFSNSNLTYSYYTTNPNYFPAIGERVYYVKLKKNIAGSMSSFNILVSATASTPLTTPLASVSSNNIAVEVLVCYQNNNKSPWLSLAGNSGANNWNGAGTAAFSFNSTSTFSLGTNPTLEINDILIVRIRVSSAWTGTITGIQITDSNF